MCRLFLLLLLAVSSLSASPCPLNWLFIGGNCYYVKTQGDRTWYGASAFCVQTGGKLVDIDNINKQIEVRELLYGYPGYDWWIGIQRSTGNSRQWNDELPLNFFGEEKVEQHAGDGEQCVFVSSDDGMWYWTSCQEMKRFICEKKGNVAFIDKITTDRRLPDAEWQQNNMENAYKLLYGDMEGLFEVDDKGLLRDNTTITSTTTSASTNTYTTTSDTTNTGTTTTDTNVTTTSSSTSTEASSTTTNNMCQGEGWLMLDEMCYKLFLDGKNWSMAEVYCGYEGGHLAGFSNSYVQKSWNDQYDFHSGSVWIGVHKNPDGIWYWAQNDSLTYTSWSESSSGQLDDNKNCGSLALHENTWNKEYCSSLKAFACYRHVNASSNGTAPTVSPGSTTISPSVCGSSDWFSHGDSCYFANFKCSTCKPTTFYSAQNECRKMSSNLALLKTSEVNSFVLNKISAGGLPVWIGLSRIGNGDVFKWIDGSLPSYYAWANGSTAVSKQNKCVSMHFETGKWEKVDCNAHLNYLCEKPQVGPAIVPPVVAPIGNASCPSGWSLLNKNKCIQIRSGVSSWSEAQTKCQSVSPKASLVNINNAVDQAYLTMVVRNISRSYWIGLQHRQQYGGFFSWSDESPFNFTNWAIGQPSVQCDSCPATCGLVSGGKSRDPGVWYDIDCRHSYSFICQQPSPPDGAVAPSVKKCPPPHSDYTMIDNICYKVVIERDTWDDANSYCRSQYGSLAYVQDAFTNAALVVLLSDSSSTNYWLGLNDQAVYGRMEWTAPWPTTSDYAPWSPVVASKQGRKTCATIDVTTGLWNYNSCASYQSYVCMYAPDLMVNVSGDGCPSNKWKHSTSNCYILSEEGITARWPEAKEACEREGYQLAVISDMNDQLAIRELTSTLTTEYNAWIGLRRKGDYGFVWVDNNQNGFTAWESGQPSLAECVTAVKNSQGRWSSMPCSFYRPYICSTPRKNVPTPSMQISAVSGGWSVFGVICLVVGVLTLTGTLINVLVKHFYFSWHGFLQTLPGKVFKPSVRPQGHHSVENLSYHHEDNQTADDRSDDSKNSTHENNELNRWNSDQELVS